MYRCESCNALITWEEVRKADQIHHGRLDLCCACAEATEFAISGELAVLADLIANQFELV